MPVLDLGRVPLANALLTAEHLHGQDVAFAHRLALLAADLLDGAFVLRFDGHLHLHRLEDDDGVAFFDRVTDLALDLPHRSGDVSFDVGHGVAR